MVASMCGISSSKANNCHDLGLHYVLSSRNFVEGNMNAERYTDILEDNLWLVIVQHFPENNCSFQDENALVHRARSVMEYW